MRKIPHPVCLWVLAGCLAGPALAAPRMGSAVTLRVNGEANYRSPEQTAELREGLALSQGHRYLPAGDAYIDSAVTMGALVRVRDGNDLLLKKLEQSADGLPGSDTDFSRHVVLEMKRGTLFLNAGDACDSIAVRVETPFGGVESGGSRFIVQQSGRDWRVVGITGETRVRHGDVELHVGAGEALTLTRGPGDAWSTARAPADDDAAVGEFNAFWLSTQSLEQYLMCLGAEGCVCFDCFTDWMGQNLTDLRGGVVPPLEFVGNPLRWLDVSPATRR